VNERCESVYILLAFAGMTRAAARGGMATGDRGVARRAKTDGFGAVPLGSATDAPRGSTGSFTVPYLARWHIIFSNPFPALFQKQKPAKGHGRNPHMSGATIHKASRDTDPRV